MTLEMIAELGSNRSEVVRLAVGAAYALKFGQDGYDIKAREERQRAFDRMQLPKAPEVPAFWK